MVWCLFYGFVVCFCLDLPENGCWVCLIMGWLNSYLITFAYLVFDLFPCYLGFDCCYCYLIILVLVYLLICCLFVVCFIGVCGLLLSLVVWYLIGEILLDEKLFMFERGAVCLIWLVPRWFVLHCVFGFCFGLVFGLLFVFLR